jgi:hypothetical protein
MKWKNVAQVLDTIWALPVEIRLVPDPDFRRINLRQDTGYFNHGFYFKTAQNFTPGPEFSIALPIEVTGTVQALCLRKGTSGSDRGN